jgi:hypothetical protein
VPQHGREVAGALTTGASVVVPELLPEHLGVLVLGTDRLLALQAGVRHALRPDPLLTDIHELEGDVVARDQLAQPAKHLGVEDVAIVGGVRRLEDSEQVSHVPVGQHPATHHDAPSS